MWACNKRGFKSHKMAKQMLKKIKLLARTNSNRHEQQIYKCPHCGEWHLTKQPKG